MLYKNYEIIIYIYIFHVYIVGSRFVTQAQKSWDMSPIQ